MQIRWTKKAVKNLEQVESYIAKDEPHAAIDVIFKIITAIENLKEHPSLGRTGRIMGTRELVIEAPPLFNSLSNKK